MIRAMFGQFVARAAEPFRLLEPTAGGTPYHRAGNHANPVFTFQPSRIGLASTAIYSADRSLFRYAARGATERVLARLHTTVALVERGRPTGAGPGRRPRSNGGH